MAGSDSNRSNDQDRDRGSNESRPDSNESRSEQEPLDRREYRGSDGQLHHHTRTYMEQHEGDSGRKSGGTDSSDRSRSDRGSGGNERSEAQR